MFNRSGITTSTGAVMTQILADVDNQFSVGCIVSKDIGVDESGKKIAKAGSPIVIDLSNLQTAATAGTTGESATANAILLHDVDVTAGNANGTALLAGVVNINRVDSTTAAKLTAGVLGNIILLKA